MNLAPLRDIHDPKTPSPTASDERGRSSQTFLVVLLVAMFKVHLPYGFSSIKLVAITAAGPQFGPPGYECNLLYLACLATLVLGGSGPLAIDGFLKGRRMVAQSGRAGGN